MGRHSCCTKQKLRKGLWSPEEDEKLFNYITRFGVGCWSSVPKLAGLQRCGKSCRLRWINYLRPDLKRGMFSQQEEDLIINLHKLLGNRWAQIAAQLPGRTDNEIKNFWNSSLKKKLMKQGINPTTHQPLKDQSSESSLPLKNDTVSHDHHPPPHTINNNGLLPPPPIMAVKSEQPIFFLDDSALSNNDQLQHHYGAGHFLIKTPFGDFYSEFESELGPGPGPTGINWALLATQDWQSRTNDLVATYGLFDLQNSEVEFSNPLNTNILPSVDSFSVNEAKESSSHSSVEMNNNSMGALSSCWDGIPSNCSKFEGLFDHYDYDDEDDHYNKKARIVGEFGDRKPDNSWLMERVGLDDQDHIQLGGSFKLISEELGSSNIDIFQHL